MEVIKGKDILFSLNGDPVACAEECDIEFATQFLAARQPNSTIGRHSIPSKVVFDIRISGRLNFAYRDWVYTPMINFLKLDFRYFTNEPLNGEWSGECWVENWGESSPTTGNARFNSSFRGEGIPNYVVPVVIGTMTIEGSDPDYEFQAF